MNEKEEESAIVINRKSLPAVMLVLLAASGGGLGSYSAWQTHQLKAEPQARADPFTGTQGAELKQQIDVIQRKQETNCEKMERRVDALETALAVIESRLERIIKILDARYYDGVSG